MPVHLYHTSVQNVDYTEDSMQVSTRFGATQKTPRIFNFAVTESCSKKECLCLHHTAFSQGSGIIKKEEVERL